MEGILEILYFNDLILSIDKEGLDLFNQRERIESCVWTLAINSIGSNLPLLLG